MLHVGEPGLLRTGNSDGSRVSPDAHRPRWFEFLAVCIYNEYTQNMLAMKAERRFCVRR